MRSFTKRLEQQELEKVQQRFAPILKAANVPFQVCIALHKLYRSRALCAGALTSMHALKLILGDLCLKPLSC